MLKYYTIPIKVLSSNKDTKECIFMNFEEKETLKEDVKKYIYDFLEKIKEKESYKEVAFIGDSIFGMDIENNLELIQEAYEYVKYGQIDGIKILTTPKYINKKILKQLKKYKVTTIELGVQSSNENILQRAGIPYTFKEVKEASKLIRRYGFKLGHQMLVGMPDSNRADELNTAKELIKLKPKIVRIYPIIIIKNTKLEEQYKEDKYQPMSLVQATEICKELVGLFNSKNIEVTRIGIQDFSSVKLDDKIVAGPYSQHFRELVESGMWYDAIVSKIKKLNIKVKEAKVIVNPSNAKAVKGYKDENIEKLKNVYDVDLIVEENRDMPQGKHEIIVTKTYTDFVETKV